MTFNITTTYITLNATVETTVTTTYSNIIPTFNTTSKYWLVTSLPIPNRLSANTTYNISITYGPDPQTSNTLEIVL